MEWEYRRRRSYGIVAIVVAIVLLVLGLGMSQIRQWKYVMSCYNDPYRGCVPQTTLVSQASILAVLGWALVVAAVILLIIGLATYLRFNSLLLMTPPMYPIGGPPLCPNLGSFCTQCGRAFPPNAMTCWYCGKPRR